MMLKDDPTRAPVRARSIRALHGVTLAMLVFSSGGCAAELEDPERFTSLPACRGDIDVEALLQERCGSAVCHGGSSSEPAGELDLTSPGLASRLVGVESTQCAGLERIDPEDPDNSFLLGKLIEPPAGCGDRMPLVGFLDQTQISCVRAWVHSVAAQGIPDGGPEPEPDAGGLMDAGPMIDGSPLLDGGAP